MERPIDWSVADRLRHYLSLRLRETDGRGHGFFPGDKPLQKALRKRGWISADLGESSPMEEQAIRAYCEANYTEAFMSPGIPVPDHYHDLGNVKTTNYHMWFSDRSHLEACERIAARFERKNVFLLKSPLTDKARQYLDAREINWYYVKGGNANALSMNGNDDDHMIIKMMI